MREGEVVESREQRARRLGKLVALVVGSLLAPIVPFALFIASQIAMSDAETTFFVADPEPIGCWVTEDGAAAIVTLTLDIEDPDEVDWGMPWFRKIRSGTLDGATIGSGRLFPPGVGLGLGQIPPTDSELEAMIEASPESFGDGGPSGSTLAFVVQRASDQPEYGFGSVVLPFVTGEPSYTQTMPVDVRVRDGACTIRVTQLPG